MIPDSYTQSSNIKTQSVVRIGVDIGGTFTDFVVYHPESDKLETFKLPSTPNDPAEAVLKGLAKIKGSQTATIIHGSTVATNALLEHKGARAALVTTYGFRDVLQIGRQNRPSLYDWTKSPPAPLIPEELRLEVNERVDCTGIVLRSLSQAEIDSIICTVESLHPESIAICLLFSFLHPEHELTIAQRLRDAGYFVSSSCEILPEFREYERTSTTAVNAYVSPVLDRYLSRLQDALPLAKLQIMQSNGGMISIAEARRGGVRCILSGPAGGVIGSQYINNILKPSSLLEHIQYRSRLITFDMGGTSTDVSLIDQQPILTTESVIGGSPIAIPMLDIHTIGAGGGSIASIDLGGALRVGPQSAGANPGPACYGRSDLPTVTDANLFLGRLVPDYFLGGQIPLDVHRSEQALTLLGKTVNMDPVELALGVIEVVNMHMVGALRVISIERGHDPKEFSLLSFGGAGGLHATNLAHSLGIPQVIIPPMASTLSAFGMLAADVVKDYVQTVMLPGDVSISKITSLLQALVRQGEQDLKKENISVSDLFIERSLDIRYRGQSYELNIPFNDTVLEDFHNAHSRLYGYNNPTAPIEIVNIRVRAIGKIPPPIIHAHPETTEDSEPAYIGHRKVIYHNGARQTPFYRGEALQPGNTIIGPAVIVRSDTTILLGNHDRAKVDTFLNLVIKTED
jgi:N-methylhydantoinase A